MPPILDADYYLHNFHRLLEVVLDRDAHLFLPQERALFERLLGLPEPAQRLYIRLFNRVGPLFRIDRLRYPEIASLEEAAAQLVDAGLARLYDAPVSELDSAEPNEPADASSLLEASALLDLFTVEELQPVAIAHGLKVKGRAALVGALLTLPVGLLQRRLLAQTSVLRPLHQDTFRHIERLFFLNDHQDATTLVVADLAHVTYPTFRVWRTRPVFVDRPAYDAWCAALAMRAAVYDAWQLSDLPALEDLFQQALTVLEVEPPGPDDFLNRYQARTVRAVGAVHALQRLESSLGRGESAVRYQRLLRLGLPARVRGEVWNRLALQLEHTGDREGALACCEAGLADEATRRGDRLALLTRRDALRQRLEKGKGPARGKKAPVVAREVVVRAQRLGTGGAGRLLFVGGAGQALTVEEAALVAYRKAGYLGLHAENELWTTLFGILGWGVLFAEVPDVFQSPYQTGPLDLSSPDFSTRREGVLARWLAALRAGEGPQLLLDHWQAHFGQAAAGVRWDAFPLPLLIQVVTVLGGERLALLFEQLAEDYGRRRRGLPDLLLWEATDREADDVTALETVWFEQPFQPPGAVFLAEVKSAGDRLSGDQVVWMEALERLGMPVQLCRVLEPILEGGAVGP